MEREYTSEIESEEAAAPASARPWILAATILGSSLAFIDGTVVNLALPALQDELGATVTEVQWVVESYALLLAALILVGGSLGDKFGRKRAFVVGTGIFALASIACAAAPDVKTLIAARGLQGIGGALLVPGSLALLNATFPRSERGRAIGLWSGFSAISSGLGLVLGGLLIDALSWRSVFWLNIPVAIAAVGITLWRVPETRDEHAERIDWLGAFLGTLGLGALTFGLIESSNLGWNHATVLASVVIGLFSLLGFVGQEGTSDAPMMPLELFADRTFAVANLLTFLLWSALAGVMFLVPLNLIQVQGYTAAEAGLASLPFVLIMSTLSTWSGGLVDKYGPRTPMIWGSLVTALGLGLFAAPGIGGSYWTTWFPAITVMGFGQTLVVAPLTTAVMTAVDTRHSGIASGVNNAVSRAAALLAIAALGPAILVGFSHQLEWRLALLALPDPVVADILLQAPKLAAVQVPAGLDATTSAQVAHAVDQAFIAAFRTIVLAFTSLAVVSAGVAAWSLRDRDIRPLKGPVPPHMG